MAVCECAYPQYYFIARTCVWRIAQHQPSTALQTSPLIVETIAATLGDQLGIQALPHSLSLAEKVVVTADDADLVVDTFLTCYIKEVLVDVQVISSNRLLEVSYGGHARRLRVTAISCASTVAEEQYAYSTSTQTEVVVIHAAHPAKEPQTVSRHEVIGGLDAQLADIRLMAESALRRPEMYTRFGLTPPRGILLYGPAGTGKTLIARVIAQELEAHISVLNGSDVISKFYGETEAKLRQIFVQAAANAPALIFIDEIDALCPKRDSAPSEVEKRVVATLLTLLDGAAAKDGAPVRVLVLAATNRPNSLDEALRRPGRFDREIEIGIPTAPQRANILRALLQRTPHTLNDDDIQALSDTMHGYVGADVASVVREAGVVCVRRLAATSQQPDVRISLADIRAGMQLVRPSAIREIAVEVPHVRWNDIGGQAEIKQKLKESVEWPLKHADAFARFGIRPPKGILLYGPPGCSKTLMAKALATEAGLNFLAVKGPEVNNFLRCMLRAAAAALKLTRLSASQLFSKWVGDSEKAVRELFRKARAASPSIVFFDEIDALTAKRGGEGGGNSVADRVLSQLLTELDGIEALVNVTVVGATNRPDVIDPALMRPGRIDRILYVAPPDLASRRSILQIQVKRMACAADVDTDQIAAELEGCSGAEAVSVCQQAALLAMQEDLHAQHVAQRHFLLAAQRLTRRITPQMIQFYDDFRRTVGVKSI
ncbi:AAA+-type ATPase [Sorochytrium milnesiophthora]